VSLHEQYFLACDREGCDVEFRPEDCWLGSRVEQLASDAGWAVYAWSPGRTEFHVCPTHREGR
jgi:hypothetical protein